MSLSHILQLGKKLKSQIDQGSMQHIKFLEDKTEIYSHAKASVYVPSKTAQAFHASNSFVRLVVGPYGSGKTTMCLNEIVRQSAKIPQWDNGRRKSRWALVRNTSGELKSTTLHSWLQWFSDLGAVKKREKPILTYEHQFNDGNGLVDLELIFIALDRPDDVRKLKSLELTGVYLNELSELPANILSHFKGRVGRYPSRMQCQDYFSGIIADSNPSDIDSWLYRDFVENPVKDYKLFLQPPGLLKSENGEWIRNPDADNADNLPLNYYLNMTGNNSDFIKVFCLGQWGLVSDGKLVFPNYDLDNHSVETIEAIQGDPLWLGWDFGLTPACIVCQLTQKGQLLVLKEYTSQDMGLRSFVQSVVLPGIARDFPYCKIGTSVADPAGGAKDTIMDELSCIGELNSVGIKTEGARTNDIEARLAAVRFFLDKMADGKPSFKLSRKGCPILHKGLARDYIYKRLNVSGEERFKDSPHKNFVSHICDALQYVCLELSADAIVDRQIKKIDLSMLYNPGMRV